MIWMILCGILCGVLLVWFVIEQHLLFVRRKTVSLEQLPPEWDGLCILQISDLHRRQMGRANCRIVQKAQELRPDWIVITGDLISRDMHTAKQLEDVQTFLTGLRKIAPVYLCLGNHEIDFDEIHWNTLQNSVKKAGCQFLLDETISFVSEKGGAPLYLSGAKLTRAIYRDENHGFHHLQHYTPADLQQALGERRGCTILLAHNPFLMDTYAAWGADLVLCGHVHGGLIRLPFLGGVLSPERKFFPTYDKGWYCQKNTQLYVSGGIGKPRFGNPPEINLLYVKSVQK